LPNTEANSIRIKANFIIIQKIDGSGNFQNIPEHISFLNDWFNTCNDRLGNLWGDSSSCSPLVHNAKVQIVPNWIFMPDPDSTEYNWNNDNEPGNNKCPDSNWWLNGLDATISSTIPAGINVYLTVDGSVYNQMVVLGTINNPEQNGMTYTWCSEVPSRTNLTKRSRVHIPNLFLKYWWFQNHPNVIGVPFTESRQWIVSEGSVLAHELGHSFNLQHIGCTNNLMTQSGGKRNTLTQDQVGEMHRYLALSSLRQYVDCGETYNHHNTSITSDPFNRVVSINELWDIDMRLYSHVTVKTGATLTVTCKLLMPLEGVIKVERGAKLIVDGGTIMRGNTCSPSQYWRAISVSGNSTKIQPVPTLALAANDAGVVILKNQGVLEGAIVGVTTERIVKIYEPEFWGGVVDVNDFTFKDCLTGVGFMKYDWPNISKFNKASFIRTSTGSPQKGVNIWDTDGILFEECTFTNMAQNGIRALDAVFNVKQKNKFSGSAIAILAGASAPLSGQIQVGVIGLTGTDRNKFENNVVGIRATANSNVEIFSNDFENSNFDIAINGTTKSAITDNIFKGSAAGNQFDNTGDNSNQNLCNTYVGNTVGTNISGTNTGFLFRQEDFATLSHDLFLEGASSNLGEIQFSQGTQGAARWNYFSTNKPENIKSSTIFPYDNTGAFFYFHPDPTADARLKPKCAFNDACTPQSNFYNFQTLGSPFSSCIFPPPSEGQPCKTKPCLEDIRLKIGEKSELYAQSPTDALKAELQMLTTEREYITDELIQGYVTTSDWGSVETLLNEDLNPANRRRKIGAKLAQKQFAAASDLLQSFPQNTNHDEYFVEVQNINIAWLTDPEFALNDLQEVTLLSIAESSSPEAGYAQTLLGILTGSVFMPRLPDLGGERSAESEKKSNPYGLLVSPNPVSNLLQVQAPHRTGRAMQQTLDLRVLATGELVYSANIMGQDIILVPVQHLPQGLYLLTLREQGAIVDRQKVIVQH